MLEAIMKQLEGVLDEATLKDIEKKIKQMVEKAAEKNSKDKIDEETSKLELHAEEYCKLEIEKGISEATEKLEKEYNDKVDLLESTIVDQLDNFLDLEISSKISDEMIKKVAINERYMPLVKGIKSLFEDQFVDLDCEGSKLLKDKEDKISELEESATNAIADKMELSEENSSLKKQLLIAEKTKAMTDTEIKKVESFCESRTFDELEKDIDNIVSVVLESNDIISDDKKIIKEDTDVAADDDCIKEELKSTPDAIKNIDDVNMNIYSRASDLLD